MNNDSIYKLINNEEAKKLIQKIPNDIKTRCTLKKVSKKQMLTLKGSDVESIQILCQGELQVTNEFENGFVYNFASIQPVGYLGVVEVMANKDTYLSTLRTSKECIVIEMKKEDFKTWIENDHEMALKVLNFVSEKMYEQSSQNGEAMAYSSLYIFSNYLTRLYEYENKDVLVIKKGREEIASILGFSVRTINRNLKKLKEEDFVSVNKGAITITKEQFSKLKSQLDIMKNSN